MIPGDDALDRIRGLMGNPPEGSAGAGSGFYRSVEGRSLGRYKVIREIARGGMGAILEGYDSSLGRRVALKILREDRAGKDEVQRLIREARVAAKLRHPNIITIHEVGAADDPSGVRIPYIAMDLVEGRTLAEHFADRSMPLVKKIALLEDVAMAAGYAHGEGVVHRDLKPQNVLVDPSGRVFLTDFGLARQTLSDDRLTRSRAILGTPNYMAPEQVSGRSRDLDSRTDVYSLGVMIYEAATGKLPYSAGTSADLYDRIRAGDFPRPSTISRSVPRDLEDICLKAMAMDPGDRYRDGAELGLDLRRFREHEPVQARPPGRIRTIRRKLARKRVLTGTVLGLVLLGAGGAPIVWRLATRASSAEKRSEEDRAKLAQELKERMKTYASGVLALRRTGDLEAARKFAAEAAGPCREAAERHPGMADPWWVLGRLDRLLLDEVSALGRQEEALKRNAGYIPARYERLIIGSRRLRNLVWERSQLAATSAMELSGQGTGFPTLNPDIVRRFLDTDPEAMATLKGIVADLAALEATSGAVPAGELSTARGLVALHRGQLDAAKRHLGEATLLDPGLAEATEGLALLELEAGRTQEALALLNEGLARDRGYVPFRLLRAQAQFALVGAARGDAGDGPLLEARADLEAALAAGYTRPETRFKLAVCHSFLGIRRITAGQKGDDSFELAAAQLRRAVVDLKEAVRARLFELRLLATNASWAQWSGQAQPGAYRPHLEAARAIARAEPGSAEAWLTLGMLETISGQLTPSEMAASIERGVEAYETAGRLIPGDPAPRFWAAGGLIKLGELEIRRRRSPAAYVQRAEAYLRAVLEADRGGAGPLLLMSDLELIAAQDPSCPPDEASRHGERALHHASEGIKIAPWAWDAHFRRSRILWALAVQVVRAGGDPLPQSESSVRDAAEAMRLNPRGPEVVQNLAQLAAYLAEWRVQRQLDPGPACAQADPAIAAFQKLRPDSPEILAAKCRSLNARIGYGAPRGQFDPEALADLKTAATRLTRVMPALADGWYYLGNARLLGGSFDASAGKDPTPLYDSAMEAYDQAIRRQPNNENFLCARGQVHIGHAGWKVLRQEDAASSYADAVAEYDRSLQASPGSLQALGMRAMARDQWAHHLQSTGRDAGPIAAAATADYREILRRSPAYDAWCQPRIEALSRLGTK